MGFISHMDLRSFSRHYHFDLEEVGGVNMDMEMFTLTLRHEMVVDGKKIQLEEPYILTHAFDRRFVGSSIVLNELMDSFKRELLQRYKEDGIHS